MSSVRATGFLIAISCVACLVQNQPSATAHGDPIRSQSHEALLRSVNGYASSANGDQPTKPAGQKTAQTQASKKQNEKKQTEEPIEDSMTVLKAQIRDAVVKGDFFEASSLIQLAQATAQKIGDLIQISDHVEEDKDGRNEWVQPSALAKQDNNSKVHSAEVPPAWGQGSAFWYDVTRSPIVEPTLGDRRTDQCPPLELPPGKVTPGLPPGTDPELIKVLAAIQAFDVGLSEYEAPIQIRFASLIVNTWWNCIATFSLTFKDALTKQRPGVTVRNTLPGDYLDIHTTEMRASAGAHAVLYLAKRLIPNTKDDVLGALRAVGLTMIPDENPFELEHLLEGCGQGADLDLACLQAAVETSLQSASEQPVDIASCTNGKRKIARLVGQVVAMQTVAYAMVDGWNQFGNEDGCKVNCRPFKDTTGFKVADGDDKWRPMEENDGLGFYFRHRHVTPHIGARGKLRFLSESDRQNLVAPDPNYSASRVTEANAVIEQMKNLNDFKKVQIETFDSKLYVTNMVIASFLPKCAMWFDDKSDLQSSDKSIHCSYERLVHFVISTINSEHDATVIVWKEKVEWNLVRPTTVIQRWDTQQINTWSPKTKTSSFKARDFEAYKRVMPHAEYPSGSSCICKALSDSVQSYLAKFECLPQPTNQPTNEPTEQPTMSAEDIECESKNCDKCLHKRTSCHSTGKKSESESECKPAEDHVWCGSHRRRRAPIPGQTETCRSGVVVDAVWPGDGKWYYTSASIKNIDFGSPNEVTVQWDDGSADSTVSFAQVRLPGTTNPACTALTSEPTMAPTIEGGPYTLGPGGQSTCNSQLTVLSTLDMCEAYSIAQGLSVVTMDRDDHPFGCFLHSRSGKTPKMRFNLNRTPRSHEKFAPGKQLVCKPDDHKDMSVMLSTEMPCARMAPFKACSSKVEPDLTPIEDVDLQYTSTIKLAEACSRSRLHGGMHFGASVPQGERLCSTIGDKGVEWAYGLI